MKKYKTPNGYEVILEIINNCVTIIGNDRNFSGDYNHLAKPYGYPFAYQLIKNDTVKHAIENYHLTPIEEEEFKTGERILVSANMTDWIERIFFMENGNGGAYCIRYEHETLFEQKKTGFMVTNWAYIKKKPSFKEQVVYDTSLFLVTVKATSVSIFEKENDITVYLPHFVFEDIAGIINQLKLTKS